MKLLKETPLGYCRACDYRHNNGEECTHGESETNKHVLILPGCCEESRSACVPQVEMWLDGPEDEETWVPSWSMRQMVPYHIRELWGQGKGPYPELTHCPYCGTKLPELELDPNAPSPITKRDFDGHCVCDANNYGRACSCWPREAMYRVKE